MTRLDEMGNQIGSVLSVSCDMSDDRACSASPPLPDGQSAPPTRTGVDPLTQLARLIAQDEAFRAITRTDAYPDGACEEPDFADALPNRRRGRRVFVALIGLVLAGAASGAAYWLWSDGRTSFDNAATSAVATASNKNTPAPAGEAGEEKPPDADLAAAASQAVPPVGVLYGPAPPQAAELTSAAAAPGSPTAPAANPPPQSNDTAATQTAPEAANPGVAHEAKYVVQLSSQRSEAAAQTTSKLLQTKYAELFAGRQPFIRRSDLGERGIYYRVLIGPLPTTGEANQLCGNLKKSGGDCVVQKN